MYTIKIHKKATKFLSTRNLSEKKLIKQKLNLLKEDPFSHSLLDIKMMKGLENVFRLRIGKIRIIYQVINDKLLILIVTAGSRGDVYKKKK